MIIMRMSSYLMLAIFVLVISVNIDLIAGQYEKMDLDGCTFPFIVNGKQYDSCTKSGKSYPWCSLSKEFKGAWKYCNDMRETTWECATNCEISLTDKYPSCRTSTGKRLYCLDQIYDESNRVEQAGSCDKKYSDISPYHTACLPPVPYVIKSTTGVSEETKKALVDLHNYWRMNVTVPAAAMLKMSWDDELAMLAQRHAERCSFQHDFMAWRSIPGTGKETGQNIVMVTGPKSYSFESVFNDMYLGERKRWNYKTGIKNEFEGKHALHYTQILLDHISKIGCGYAECVYADRVEKLYVCNFDNSQNVVETKVPYKEGKQSCESCPDTCVDGKLCDCGGKECFNYGQLDPNTCTCKCHGFWTGDDCSKPVKQRVNELDCYDPFVYDGSLVYGCMFDPVDGYFCSKTPFYSGHVEYCEDDNLGGSNNDDSDGLWDFKRSVRISDSDSFMNKIHEKRHHRHNQTVGLGEDQQEKQKHRHHGRKKNREYSRHANNEREQRKAHWARKLFSSS